MPNPGIGRLALAPPLMFGLIPAIGGYQFVGQGAAEGTALVVVGAFLILSGATMLASAVWLLVSQGRQQFPLWSGGIASRACGCDHLTRAPLFRPDLKA